MKVVVGVGVVCYVDVVGGVVLDVFVDVGDFVYCVVG